MRWAAYFILAYVAVGLQIGLSAYDKVAGAAPNLVLLAVVFVAVNAPKDAALLGCFCLGVMQDLVTTQPPGLYALSYGLVAMFIISTQQVVYREHPLTHFTLALVGGLMTAAVLLLHGWLYPPGPEIPVRRPGDIALPALRLSPATEFARVIYTALLAVPILGILQRIKRVFAFQPPRRRL